MRIMTLAEVAASRGLTIEGLAVLRAHWMGITGEEAFPMTVGEIEWQIGQYNTVAAKYVDQKRTIARAIEFIGRHCEVGAKDYRLELDADQVDALLSILRGVD